MVCWRNSCKVLACPVSVARNILLHIFSKDRIFCYKFVAEYPIGEKMIKKFSRISLGVLL